MRALRTRKRFGTGQRIHQATKDHALFAVADHRSQSRGYEQAHQAMAAACPRYNLRRQQGQLCSGGQGQAAQQWLGAGLRQRSRPASWRSLGTCSWLVCLIRCGIPMSYSGRRAINLSQISDGTVTRYITVKTLHV